MRYRPTTPQVLRGLTFDIPAGTKVGVVGRTGAGKSTLLMALSRIAEIESGKIFIDDKNISKHDITELRSHITVIEQDPTLFTGSLRFNLDPFNKYSSAAIEELLIKAGLSDLLNREPEDDTTKKNAKEGEKKRAESEITS